ncbi:tumor necrosis factor receptor superfamily member 5 [Mugil cephalus]|uniref:tumor necrosis factor receptor superfamily member 5 n=1 Tax=Mugil cephalus TaxID=48193 RepID=UPI001FB8481D|nr:tumor necrosis factor receptor superfamily member 5 [Mugil cephalus]
MAEMNCTSNQYLKNGRCCDRCPAGTYLKTDCNGNRGTECATCQPGTYIDTINYLSNCHTCRPCHSSNNLVTVKNCTATQNTVCKCETGFYCVNEECEHCFPVSGCPPGSGVKSQATRTTNTVCTECGNGTFSNVTDFHSPCTAHTRCDLYGRHVKTEGTSMTDTICGNFKFNCHWMLPAGLWSGLVFTLLIVFVVLLLWRVKRKSYKAVSSSIPVNLVEMVPAPPVCPSEQSSHCQETCTINDLKLTLFDQDDTPVISDINHSLISRLPKPLLKASVSFVESSHINGNSGYCTGNFIRSHSEPQEDEWWGTTD